MELGGLLALGLLDPGPLVADFKEPPDFLFLGALRPPQRRRERSTMEPVGTLYTLSSSCLPANIKR